MNGGALGGGLGRKFAIQDCGSFRAALASYREQRGRLRGILWTVVSVSDASCIFFSAGLSDVPTVTPLGLTLRVDDDKSPSLLQKSASAGTAIRTRLITSNCT